MNTSGVELSPPVRHDREVIPAAMAALGAGNHRAGSRLRRGAAALVASSDWQTAITRPPLPSLAARYLAGDREGISELPGDLVLLRLPEGDYALAQRRDGRWLWLGGDGTPLSPVSGFPSGVEMVMMKTPDNGVMASGIATLAALWPQLRAAWVEIGLSSVYINAGQLLLPIFAMMIYDKIAPNGLFDTLWALVIGMAIYLVTDIGMRLVRSWATERIGENLTLRGDDTIWTRLMAQRDTPAGGFSRFLSSYHDLVVSRDFVSSSYLLSIADIPFLILYLAVIWVIAWQLMLVVVFIVVAYGVVGVAQHLRLIRLSREAELSNIRKMAFMGETLGSLDVIRSSPGSRAFFRRWRELVQETTSAEISKRLTARYLGILTRSMQTVTSVVILSVGVYLIHDHLMSNGRLIASNLLASRAMGLVASLFAVIGKWEDFVRAAGRMEESLDEVEERQYLPRDEIQGKITVVGVGKVYPGRPPALDGVGCAMAPGERIALLGRPGAGKSTLLRCIGGLCRPDSGRILIDGLAIDDISPSDRARFLAYKPQDPVLFAGTLEENLRISGCDDSDRFAAAIRVSGLETEFASGRMSLGMVLDERGGNLSGGQRQKVALARAFAQPCRILLLDEPTLGLDPESERFLAARLPEILDPAAVLVMTTHSAVMLETVERIIALDGGRVVADGPREKLVRIPPAGQQGAGGGK